MTEPQVTYEITPAHELTPGIWHMISEMAPVMYKSRLFGVTSPEAAAAIMLKGFDLGLSMTASFELVQVVQGKPALSPRGAMALLLNSPKIKSIEVKRVTDKNGTYVGHTCKMVRANGFEYETRFTVEDAKRAGLVKPGGGWESYPENMCQWRAIGFCADLVAPDIVAGMTGLMKMPEQYGVTITKGGEVIDAQPIPATVPESTPVIDITALVTQYGAEAVLVANAGRIPATDDELVEVARKLAGG